MSTWLLAALAAFAALPDDVGGAGERFRLETRDGRRVEGRLLDADADSFRLEVDGEVVTRDAEDVLFLWGLEARAPERVAPPDLVLLAAPEGGFADRLWGRLEGGDEFGLTLGIDAGVPLELPFDAVDRLLPAVDRPLDRLVDLADGGFDDRLWRRRPDGGLDGLTGVLARLDGRAFVMESPLGELTFAPDEVLAVVLAATEHPGGRPAGRPVTVRLAGGSVFEAGLRGVSDGALLLETWFAPDLALPLECVASVLVGGRTATPGPLERYEPVEVEEWPALGGPEALLFPWRRGLSVSGGPLRVDGVLRTTGLGVHANARLRFAVPQGAGALRITAGLLDEVLELPAVASVTFAVRVDGETVAETGVVREGDPPVELRIGDLRAGQVLELVTLDAGDLDAGDRAAWVDGVYLAAPTD